MGIYLRTKRAQPRFKHAMCLKAKKAGDPHYNVLFYIIDYL